MCTFEPKHQMDLAHFQDSACVISSLRTESQEKLICSLAVTNTPLVSLQTPEEDPTAIYISVSQRSHLRPCFPARFPPPLSTQPTSWEKSPPFSLFFRGLFWCFVEDGFSLWSWFKCRLGFTLLSNDGAVRGEGESVYWLNLLEHYFPNLSSFSECSLSLLHKNPSSFSFFSVLNFQIQEMFWHFTGLSPDNPHVLTSLGL